MFITLTLLSLLLYFYYKINSIYKYWERKGVYYVKPSYFFGNIAENVFQKKSIATVLTNLYNSNTNARCIGVYQFFTPTLIIKDPELLKQITVKHFDAFPDHHLEASKKADPLWANTLLLKTMATGWQETRSKITPIFTGKKLRIMVPLIQNQVIKLIEHLQLQQENAVLDVKQLFSRLQNDIVATVAFGVEINTFVDKNNPFYILATEASNFTGLRALIFYGYSVFPNFMKFFRIKMFNTKVCVFFRNLIEETIKIRRKEKIYRPDFVHLLAANENILNASNVNTIDEKQLSTVIDDITAQSLFFFFAGFESISSVMSFVAYELALNPDVQLKVYKEITTVIANGNKEITYEAINNMKYLDNVISEILRLYSPSALVDRKSIKSFTIEPSTPEEQPIHIDKNTFIWIPLRNIQRDPKYYSNPEKFDPERFTRDKIEPYTYIPFGTGPRMCIGARFSLMVLKIVFIVLIRHYEILRAEQTEVPLTFQIDAFFTVPKNGISLKLKSRI